MERVVKIALDVSGPAEQIPEKIAGCVDSCSEHEDVNLVLLGDKGCIENALASYGPLKNRIQIVNVSQVINETDAPVQAVRDKQDSALVKGLTLVKNSEAGAFLFSGSPQVLKAGSQMLLGKIDRLGNAPMATFVPGINKPFLLIDSGSADTNVRPSDFVLFSRMGSLYMQYLSAEQRPEVRLLSDAAIPENGGTLYRDSYELLRRCREINFGGTIKPRELHYGKADVIVCDGFVGRLMIDMIDGFIKGIASVSVKRKHSFFGKTRETDYDGIITNLDISARGLTFFPGIKGNVMSICEKPYRDTIQKAIGYASRLIKEDIEARLISNLKL
ncbi:MAG: hypothetical protein K6E95_05810 [Lachnospiraceae bacterium]|nr:hypothetical protein [Lachnospiraceae bacterium]